MTLEVDDEIPGSAPRVRRGILRLGSRPSGCASQGATEEEALANIADAVREYMEVAVENAAGTVIREIEVAV